MKSKFFQSKYTWKGLKHIAAGTIGGAVAAGGMAALAAPLGEKKDAAASYAGLTLKLGAGLAGAYVFRKHIARGAYAGGKAIGRSVNKDMGVMFRRVRGRIIPIKRKV